MARLGLLALVVSAVAMLAVAGEGAGASPPRVVASSPAAGARGVDPALKEISVTFSEPMEDGSWSWAYEDAAKFPQRRGEPSYRADGRTCVLPVKLEPDKEYVVWINTSRFRNFRSRRGVAAEPFRLAFTTR